MWYHTSTITTVNDWTISSQCITGRSGCSFCRLFYHDDSAFVFWRRSLCTWLIWYCPSSWFIGFSCFLVTITFSPHIVIHCIHLYLSGYPFNGMVPTNLMRVRPELWNWWRKHGSVWVGLTWWICRFQIQRALSWFSQSTVSYTNYDHKPVLCGRLYF